MGWYIKKTLEYGGKTVAVLGSGVDSFAVYPRHNAWLADEIVKQGGALVSEYPPGTRARKEYFPSRNRIIAAFSMGTVIIEAGIRSGSLITARLALEDNRDVFSVPGPITKPSSKGTNELLKMGAIPCTDFTTVLDGLGLDQKKQTDNTHESPKISDLEKQILDSLSEDLHIDSLSVLLNIETSKLSSILVNLELKGLVQQTANQRWIRCESLHLKKE